MWISRLRVNGGFLNGVDVTFTRGLNVVIGPRGAGKTTLLELIRHALGAEDADRSRAKSRQAFLGAVLGAGEVLLDLEDDGGGYQVIVDSRGRGRRPELASSVLVLGQSELEDIASDAENRLNLIDLRADGAMEALDLSRAGELTLQLFDVRKRLDELDVDELKRAGLEADLALYKAQEASLIGDATSPLATQRDTLKHIEEAANALARQSEVLSGAKALAAELQRSRQEQVVSAGRLASLLEESTAAVQAKELLERLDSTAPILTKIISSIDSDLAAKREAEVSGRELAAPIRAQLEEAESGLGQITAHIRNLDTQLRDLDEAAKSAAYARGEIKRLERERDGEFQRFEAAEERLFEARLSVARETSRHIDNHISVVIRHLADSSNFAALLKRSLQGSHTRSSTVEGLASRLLPRLLLDMVECNDVDALVAAGEISSEQALKVISALNSGENLAELATVSLSDSVDFLLTDGAVEKSVDSLSTGQKCAVTLPIILAERDRTLVLDQPEDHLDNAYLVDHVVTGMQSRSEGQVQTIVATHNANIPVLGSAESVFVLASDGANGAVNVRGAFSSPEVVKAITKFMEGGSEAFASRARFYGEFGLTE